MRARKPPPPDWRDFKPTMVGPDDPRCTDPRHPRYKLPPDSSAFIVADESQPAHKAEPTLGPMLPRIKRGLATGFEALLRKPAPPSFVAQVADAIVDKLKAKGVLT